MLAEDPRVEIVADEASDGSRILYLRITEVNAKLLGFPDVNTDVIKIVIPNVDKYTGLEGLVSAAWKDC